jgi:hypothetical protein
MLKTLRALAVMSLKPEGVMKRKIQKKFIPNREKNENKKYLINVTIKFKEPTNEESPAT